MDFGPHTLNFSFSHYEFSMQIEKKSENLFFSAIICHTMYFANRTVTCLVCLTFQLVSELRVRLSAVQFNRYFIIGSIQRSMGSM